MDEEREREEGGTKKRCRECRVEEKRDRGRIGKAEWWEWGRKGSIATVLPGLRMRPAFLHRVRKSRLRPPWLKRDK